MKIVLFGASGHGKVVADIVRAAGHDSVAGFIDDDSSKKGGVLDGVPVLGTREILSQMRGQGVDGAIVTIGDNAMRNELALWLEGDGFVLATAIHPSAVVAPSVVFGAGTVVMANAVINAGTHVGRNVIVNTGATVDHDSTLGDGCHVSPGAHLAGRVSLGTEVQIGIGVAVLPNLTIGARSIVGGGAAVITNVPAAEVWAGNPARRLRAIAQLPAVRASGFEAGASYPS